MLATEGECEFCYILSIEEGHGLSSLDTVGKVSPVSAKGQFPGDIGLDLRPQSS